MNTNRDPHAPDLPDKGILSIRANVSTLTEDQFLNVVLIDEVQRTQSGLSSVLYTLSNGVPPAEKAQRERRVDQLETRLRELTRLYYRMTEQSKELHRVSWQLLEKQE